jgi:hypothetical protein
VYSRDTGRGNSREGGGEECLISRTSEAQGAADVATRLHAEEVLVRVVKVRPPPLPSVQTGRTALPRLVQTGRTSLPRLVQTGRTSLPRLVQNGRTSLPPPVQTGRVSLRSPPAPRTVPTTHPPRRDAAPFGDVMFPKR